MSEDTTNPDYIVKKMLGELQSINRETRAEAIVLEAHLEFWINEILKARLGTDDLRRISFKNKLIVLRALDLIDTETEQDLSKIEEIRNIFAHRIDVYDEKTRDDVRQLVDNLNYVNNNQKNMQDRNTQDRLYFAGSFILNDLVEKYQYLTKGNF